MLFDDPNWRNSWPPSAALRKHAQNHVAIKLQQTHQVMKVLSLLVAQHSRYKALEIDGDWRLGAKDRTGIPAYERIINSC